MIKTKTSQSCLLLCALKGRSAGLLANLRVRVMGLELTTETAVIADWNATFRGMRPPSFDYDGRKALVVKQQSTWLGCDYKRVGTDWGVAVCEYYW